MRRPWLLPAALSALAFLLALGQRPGLASSDTKIDLHVDPAGFLASVAEVWTASGALGHVQGGQYGGYLFPMGPFFAGGHALGLPAWLVHRLWLGTLLALAAWGVVTLVRDLLPRGGEVAAATAGVFILLNPYVVVFANRTSVTLLGLAVLPWLLVAVHRGMRDPRGWWWPGAVALLITASGGGVNAAVTAWLLLGPALLVLYEASIGGAGRRAVLRFGGRTALLAGAASIWWAVPVLVQAGYGIDFLQFTEQPGTIWGTTSLTESLRLMGYWVSYVGVGFAGEVRPYFGDGPVLLFEPLVVVPTLLVPALALTGLAWVRRWRYVPFLALLVLGGLVVMVAGFPEGTPLRKALTFTYNRVEALQFLRTTYKAAPLVAVGLAGLLGASVAYAWHRAGPGRRGLRVAGGIALVGLLCLSAWPLVGGRAVDRQLMWEEIPAAWRDAGSGLDSKLAPNTRAVVLPGQLFAFYEWGATIDPILPSLTERPVAVRNIVPYADLHAIDLLWEVDRRVQQERLLPGQLEPLLGLLGAGAVVQGTDDDRGRSGAAGAATAAGQLEALGPPDRSYGPRTVRRGAAGTLERSRRLPQVRTWSTAGERTRGLVRVAPTTGTTVLDGSAAGLAGLAALDGLPKTAPILYAGDATPAEIIRAAAGGGEIVVSDSNRRQVFVASRLRQNQGATLAPGDPITEDAAVLDPFAPGAGEAGDPDAQTVTVLDGIRYVRAPFSPGFPQFPERRPFAALDGDLSTAWQADRNLDTNRRTLEIGFERPRDVPWVELVRQEDPLGLVEEVTIAGRRFPIRRGVNRLELGLKDVEGLEIDLSQVRQPDVRTAGAGGLAEVRIPGLRVDEALRPPVLAERALAADPAAAASAGLTYLFERTTGDAPFRRERYVTATQDGDLRDRGDGEEGIERRIDPPVTRAWTADGWASVATAAPDAALDELAGTTTPGVTFESSSRWLNRGAFRASSVRDGTAARGWVGGWVDGAPAWIGWRGDEPQTIRSLRLAPLAGVAVRQPTSVKLKVGAQRTGPLPVVDGVVRLARPLRGTSVRLEILEAEFPPGTAARERARRAVGIGEIEGTGLPRRTTPAPGGGLPRSCDLAVAFGDREVTARLDATVGALDRGEPLRVRPCDPVTVPAGSTRVSAPEGPVRFDLLRLRSRAPGVPPVPSTPRVVDPGAFGSTAVDGVRLDLPEPAWLVLGQSYNAGWSASCDGEDLGPPRVLDGYANAWLAPAGCERAAFSFGPQKAVWAAYVASGLACLLIAGLGLVRRSRRRRWLDAPAPPPEFPAARAPRLPVGRAAGVAVAAALVVGFCFAIRAGIVALPLLWAVLWRGVPSRTLVLAAGGLLGVAVPLVYVLFPPQDRGGFSFTYPVDLIAAHWLGVAAFVCLALVLARTLAEALSTARAPRGAPRGSPP